MRLIDADALRDVYLRYSEAPHLGLKGDMTQGMRMAVSTCIELLDNERTVDAVEVVHSAWKLNGDGSGTCQNCHRTTKGVWDYDNWYNYCPDCGAKMDLPEVQNEAD